MSEPLEASAPPAAKKRRVRKVATHQDNLRLRLARSGIATPVDQKATIRALGFRWVGDVVERPDTRTVRGMIRKIAHLVEILKTEN
ncbi:MAG TPA: 50S ribosomal protein L30 [Thermoanaerobaculia bacterium]